MNPTDLALAVSAAALLAAAIVAMGLATRWRQRRTRLQLAEAVAEGRHVPASLHPVIDLDRCMGSASCVAACPEGEIIGMVDGHAHLLEGARCIGHGRCAEECPVGAIRLVFGTSERGVDLPHVDEQFESSRPGVHVVGELGGMGLIRNAFVQGLQVSEFLRLRLGGGVSATATTEVTQMARFFAAGGGSGVFDRVGQLVREGAGTLSRALQEPRSRRSKVDVLIVGAGPAGLATAVGCRHGGLTFRVVEQETVGGSVAHFPRHKVVMTERMHLPGYGAFGKPLISKEELVESFADIMRRTKVKVDEGVRVLSIEGQDGDFQVSTSRGTYPASKVVLATGRRGTPRKLGVPGEDLPKVTYRLEDPAQYAGKKVLVVGGGDSALEAACQLADETDAVVAISYRGEVFARCRDANKRRISERARSGRIQALMRSSVAEITEERVVLQVGEQHVPLHNDYVIVQAGADLPAAFLESLGISIERHFGSTSAPHALPAALGHTRPQEQEERDKRRRVNLLLVLAGLGIVAGLGAVGFEYYLLPQAERFRSELHELLRPAGSWGHGVGIVATLFMLTNFLYAARKRLQVLKRKRDDIRSWLKVHVFVGLMSPLVIAFHAAFQSNSFLATATFGALLVVVGTGILGRFIYALVPAPGVEARELAQQVKRWQRHLERLEPLLGSEERRQPVRALLELATAPVSRGAPLSFVTRLPAEWLRARAGVARVRSVFPDPATHDEFRRAYLGLTRARVQVAFQQELKRLLAGWRAFHVVLAGFLVMVIVAHIGVSVFLGFRWIF